MGRSKNTQSSLDEIVIKGLGVIDNASITFSPGFTAITGETGAGKTMVLTALGLITGSKADSDFVRTTAERSTVSAQFTVNPVIASRVTDAGGDVDGEVLVIARSVTNEGKSRITLGGTLSTTSKVHDISSELIEIHAQSSSIRLGKPTVQRDLLDSFGGVENEMSEYSEKYVEYLDLSNRIATLLKESSTADKQVEILKEFVRDFSAVMPISGEIDSIENEINRLGSVEDIHVQLSQSLNILENDESGALSSVGLVKKSLDYLTGKDTQLDPLIDKYGEALYGLEEVARDLVSYLSNLEADPQRFEFLQQRKQAINSLIKRYGKGSDRALAFEKLIEEYADAEIRIADLSGGAERVAQLQIELKSAFQAMSAAALKLHEARSTSAKKIGKLITAELSALSMPNAEVCVEVTSGDYDKVSSYGPSGADEIIFQFSPHAGSKLMPLSKIASGGEMSRLMLAIEVVIAKKSPVGTYVFDEVDAGVGGKAAVEVGRRLALLAQTSQVIVVTHLPQVAVWADNHLVVKKDQAGSITESSVTALSAEERLREIARMLSGQEDSQTAQKHAEELLQMVKENLIS